MITRRDALIGVLTALTTLGAVALAQTEKKEKPLVKSAVFELDKIKDQETKTGSRKSLFDGRTTMLEMFECHTSTVNPGQETHPPRPQVDEELVIVKEGTVETLVGDKLVRVGPGSVIFAASNDPHGLKNVGEKPATYYVVRWIAAGTAK